MKKHDHGNKSKQLRKAHREAKRGVRSGKSTAMSYKNKNKKSKKMDYSDYPGYA